MDKPKNLTHVGIDADLVAYRSSFAAQDKTFEDCMDIADELMGFIIAETVSFNTGDNVSGYLTGKGNFRFDIAKTYPYKGNRKSVEKPLYLENIRDYLVDHWKCEVVQGIEADDALAMEAVAFTPFEAYVIATYDKDLKTVPGWKFNFLKDEFEFTSETMALKYFYEQVLTGDLTDNIKGIFGVGPKKAQKILEGLYTETEMYKVVLDTYKEKCTDGEPLDRLVENARLLHMLRYEGELWNPPI